MKNHKLLRAVPLVLVAAMMLMLVPLVSAEEDQTVSVIDYSSSDMITVLNEQNLAPIAENLEFCTYKNIAFEGELLATDPEGDTITFRLVEKPARGAVTLAEDGSGRFVYTPFENKTGKDTFTYAAVDENGNISQTATVRIRIEKNKAKMTYADMDGDSAHYAALCLAAEGVFVGEQLNGEYFFRPDEAVTRSEFTAMAMQAAGIKPIEGVTRTGFFDDEVIATWAKPYVASALKTGVVRGNMNDAGQVVFRGESTISYAEASVVLNRLFSITDVANIPVTTLAEGEAAPVWAYQSAANLDSVRVMSMTNISLNATLTRAEAAELLVAAMAMK